MVGDGTGLGNCLLRVLADGNYCKINFCIEAITITVEVNIASGTKYYIVGLPDVGVKESYAH